MIDEAEALRRILESTPGPVVEEQPLVEAAGHYLCEGRRATVPLPGFDQSSMDGYAVRSGDLATGDRRLQVIGGHAAGSAGGLCCGAGEAVRVFTGAPLPEGADAVVMQEDVRREGDFIELLEAVAPGEFVRRAGEVICRGQAVCAAGDLLDAARVGLLASQGIERVRVGRRPKVAVLTTGDELVPAGGTLGAGQIYNSNAPMLCAAAARSGAGEVLAWHARDDLTATVDAIGEALTAADILLIAGGVSVGERDLVKPALVECGIEQVFWRVRVRPGKPLLYATAPRGRQVFGLPGNPVSALVCFTVFVLPALQWRCGAIGEEVGARRLPAVLAEPLSNPSDRPHYIRGRFDPTGRFSPTGLQESHGLLGMAEATALVRIGAETEFAAGQVVQALLMPA